MKKDATTSSSEDSTNKDLQKWLKKFTESWEYAQQNYHKRWENNWKLYHNKRVKRNHPGTVEAFVPMVNSTVNTIVASLFSNTPSIDYIPNHPDQEAGTAVLNEVYQDFARRNNWVQKDKINGRQGIITGNFCAYYEWVNDDAAGGYVKKTIVPVRDMIIDPQATDYTNWRYVGRRLFVTKKSLEDETIYDIKTGKNVPRYTDLDKIVSGGSSFDRQSDKSIKDQVLGAVAPGMSDEVELLEIWTPKKVGVVANRQVLIEERDNPNYVVAKARYEQRKTEHELERALQLEATGEDIGEFTETFDEKSAGLMPFAHGCDYQDISLIYGSSDVDIIADEQELLNTLTELNIEAEMYTLFPEKTLDPKFSTWTNDLSPAPGKVYPFPAGAMTWNNPPAIPNNAFNERQNIKDEIREAASVSQISKGVTATDNTTATEIKAMLGQSDVRIQEKAQNLADGFFFQEATIVLKLLQTYAPEQFYVRTIDDAGVNFESVDMTKFLGNYTPMVTLAIQKKLDNAEKQQAYTNAFQMLIQDPTNDLRAAKRIMYKKMMPDLTDEEISEIIGKDSQNAMQDLPQNSQPQPMPEQPMADQPQQMQPEGQM